MELVKQVRQCGRGMGIGNMMLNDRVAVCFLNDRLSQKIAGRCNGVKHIPINMTHRTNLKRIKTVLEMFEDVYVNELDFDLIKTLRKADVKFRVYKNKLKQTTIKNIEQNGSRLVGVECSYELNILKLLKTEKFTDFWYVGYGGIPEKKRGTFNPNNERSFLTEEEAFSYAKDSLKREISCRERKIAELSKKLAKLG